MNGPDRARREFHERIAARKVTEEAGRIISKHDAAAFIHD